MRLKKLEIRNYKRFVDKKTYEFKKINKYDPNSDLTLIIGNNGTGKSSILQAIVLVTASASREGFTIDSLDWPGFEYRHMETGRLPCQISCTFEFSQTELDATVEYARKLKEKGIPLGKPPSKKSEVKLKYDYQKSEAVASTVREYYQFSGYQYAKRLAKLSTEKTELFDKVGNIYWYTEQRTSHSTSKTLDADEIPEIDWLRTFLSNAYSFHIAVTEGKRELYGGQFDFYDKLHNLYKKVFPSRAFIGSTPNFDVYDRVQFHFNVVKNHIDLTLSKTDSICQG